RCGGACSGVRSFGGTAFFDGGDGFPKFYGCGGRLLGLLVRRELLRRCGGFDGCRNGRFGCGLQDPAQQSGARQHGDGAHSSSSGGSALWTGPARARACTWWSRTVEGTVTTTSTMCPVRSQVMREASLASAVIRACPQAMWVPWAALSAAASAARSAAVAARSRSRRAAAVMATARVRNQSRRLRDTHQTVADPVSEYTGRIESSLRSRGVGKRFSGAGFHGDRGGFGQFDGEGEHGADFEGDPYRDASRGPVIGQFH